MRDKTCCFTGHRDLPAELIPEIKERTEAVIRKIITTHGVCRFYVGGAIGYDTLAAEILFHLRDTEFPDITVVLAYPFEGFVSRWGAMEKERYNETLLRYNDRICVSQKPYRGVYFARDRYLVDQSAYCVAYCTRDTGGTAYTLRYARKKNLEITNLAL